MPARAPGGGGGGGGPTGSNIAKCILLPINKESDWAMQIYSTYYGTLLCQQRSCYQLVELLYGMVTVGTGPTGGSYKAYQ